MNISAAPFSQVGGNTLTVKTAAGEFSASLTELHDARWNSNPPVDVLNLTSAT